MERLRCSIEMEPRTLNVEQLNNARVCNISYNVKSLFYTTMSLYKNADQVEFLNTILLS